MGGSESKSCEPFESLTDEEQENISVIYNKMANGKPKIIERDVMSYTKQYLTFDLGTAMYLWMKSQSKQNDIQLADLKICLIKLIRGSITDTSHIVLYLATQGQSSCTGDVLAKFVGEVVKSYIKIISKNKEYKTWLIDSSDEDVNRLSLYLLDDLFFTGDAKDKGIGLTTVPTSTSYDVSDIENWLSKSSLMLQILHHVFSQTFDITMNSEESDRRHSGPRLPLVSDADWNKFKTVLDLPSLIYLISVLPSEMQSEWRLLFSNRLYGDSFVQLVQRILGQGPTVVIVKDKGGHLFGGFASESWKKHSSFYGNSQCLLFQLQPYLSVFTPTGYNDHYLYFNQHVQTLPNGLGFGGQYDYFGLWLDHNFSNGHSKAGPRCTTYSSPQLSALPEFEVDTVEVWGVGPRPKQGDEDEEALTEEERKSRKSILDKDPGAKAMLELIGRTPHSEGLREGDETADSPEEFPTTNTVISLF